MFCFLFSRWLLRPFVGCTQNALQNYKKFSIYASTKCMPQHFSAILAVKRTDYNRTSCPARVYVLSPRRMRI